MNIRAAKFVQNLRGLTAVEKSVALNVSVHADYKTAEANMSMALLARESGLEDRMTASRVIKRLEDYGVLVAVGRGHSKGGRGRTTPYVFTFAVNRECPVTVTSAEAERNCDSPVADKPAVGKINCDSVGKPATNKPVNCDPRVADTRLNCDSPVADTKLTAILQSHEGFPSSTFRDFSEARTAIDDSLSTDHREGAGETARTERKPKANPFVVGEKSPTALTGTGLHSVSFEVKPPPSSGSSLINRQDSPTAVRVLSSHNTELKDENQGQDAAFGDGGHKGNGQEKTNLESRSDALIAAARRRQVERKAPDAEIFREAKAVFDRLRQEYNAWSAVSWSERERLNLPRGTEIENDLKTNKEHRHDFAEMYRSLGRDITLAKWEDFLVNVDHNVTARGEGEVERTYLMEHFIQLNGVSVRVQS